MQQELKRRRLAYKLLQLTRVATAGVFLICGCGCATSKEAQDELRSEQSLDFPSSDAGSTGTPNASSAAANTLLPPECTDALRWFEAPARPGANSSRRWANSQANPERSAFWNVRIRAYKLDADGNRIDFDAAQVAHDVNCVADYLANRGLDAHSDAGDAQITLEASLAQLGDVLRAAVVESFEIDCTAAGCDVCYGYTEPECSGDPFCYPEEGYRLDAAQGCFDLRFAGCLPAGGCAGAISEVVGPDGACWWFAACVPEPFLHGEDCADAITQDPSEHPCPPEGG